MFDVAHLVALPLEPCIRVRVSPEQTVEVSQEKLELHKQDLLILCSSIPLGDGLSYRMLLSYTKNNGLLAKLLVGLGALLGVWKMHPSVDRPELWKKSPLYPMAMPKKERESSVPKPSRGDLEEGVKACSCCGRDMGPANSRYHEVTASEEKEGICTDCDTAGCDPGGPCQWDKVGEEFESVFKTR